MALNQDFLDSLDREIGKLKGRIRSLEERVSAGTHAVEEPQMLSEAEGRLTQLEQMRKNIVMQSHGG